MSKRLKGADISHWQGSVDWPHYGGKFVICKATESTSYVDPKYAANRAGARRAGVLFGAYHFARGGNPTAEADHFIKAAGLAAGEIAVLDWEIAYKGDADQWAAEFIHRVKSKTGKTALLYVNMAGKKTTNWAATRKAGAGLWIARYGKSPAAAPWPFYAMWQHSDKGRIGGVAGPVDTDTFYGDTAAWAKYAGGKPAHKAPAGSGSVEAPRFPLPAGHYFGPKSGPKKSVSGFYHKPHKGNPDLKKWQERMRGRGWHGIGTPDGLYGPKTSTVSRQFQKSKNLLVDGKIGPKTWAAAWEEPIT